ncbi:hypothetical protein [Methylosinus sp. RM1]|uniref:hypothetical protein n=1 Tax=Methylosinus sp. RM1 TaxID=2583817 RepID=UPI00140DDE87|nr:hypothetical protein [Methylosinus sp. RM1]
MDLEALALEKRALMRRRGVPDAKALLRLALARGPGGMSLRQTAAWAQLSGVADSTDASLNDRLHQSCDFLAAIVTHLLQAKAPCPRRRGRSKTEKGGRSWTYAHLILAILTDECSQDLLDSSPGRPARGALRAVDLARAKARHRDIARRDPRSPHARRLARRFPEIPPPPRRTPKKTKIAVQIPRQPLS